MSFKYEFSAQGSSDDMAWLTGVEESEYETPCKWYDFVVDGKVVGRARMNYDRWGSWVFEVESDVEIRTSAK